MICLQVENRRGNEERQRLKSLGGQNDRRMIGLTLLEAQGSVDREVHATIGLKPGAAFRRGKYRGEAADQAVLMSGPISAAEAAFPLGVSYGDKSPVSLRLILCAVIQAGSF